jgi:hypothetical protein
LLPPELNQGFVVAASRGGDRWQKPEHHSIEHDSVAFTGTAIEKVGSIEEIPAKYRR